MPPATEVFGMKKTLGLWLLVVSLGAAETVPLRNGWNGVAFQAPRVANLSASSDVVGLASFEGTGYQLGSFTAAEVNRDQGGRRGFWVFANAATSFSYDGEGTTGSPLTLRSGWNLISLAQTGPVTGSQISARVDGQTVPVTSVVLSAVTRINADGTYTTVDLGSGSLEGGRPYWVFASRDVVLSWGAPQSTGMLRVSLSSQGAQGNAGGYPASRPAVSDEGRYVAFDSIASNLVSGDTNGTDDIFLNDRQTAQTVRLSESATGTQANAQSHNPALSADGRYAVFDSKADNLVPADTNERDDIIRVDLQTGSRVLVSVSSGGVQGNDHSRNPSISGDGRYVAFVSQATNLVAGDTNNRPDAFVRDLQTGTTTRVSVGSTGVQGTGSVAEGAELSRNGRFVAFQSGSANLVPGDTNGFGDIFLHDRQTGQTVRASLGSNGVQALGQCFCRSRPSDDGRYVCFTSGADNLVPNDTNFATSAAGNDVFVRDLVAGTIARVSVTSEGLQGEGDSDEESMSSDGRYIAFKSLSRNFVANYLGDLVMLHDRQTGQTRCVSVTPAGTPGNRQNQSPALSASGLFIAFRSSATDLVPGDTNGVSDYFSVGR